MRPNLPDYGVFLRWPHPGESWVHPEDLDAAQMLIPGDRVFRRFDFDGDYYHYNYGDTLLRLKPAMWLPVNSEGLDIGNLVEVLPRFGRNEPMVGRIGQMRYDREEARIRYWLIWRDQLVPHGYLAEDLRNLTPNQQLRPGNTVHPVPRYLGA